MQEEAGFTIEHYAVGTGVGIKTIFKDEANRQTVTQVFRALDAPTGAGAVTGIHREAVDILDSAVVHINVGIVQAKVNDTIELNVSSKSGTGESAENCNSSQSLFHDLSPSLFLDLQELSFCKNRRTEHE